MQATLRLPVAPQLVRRWAGPTTHTSPVPGTIDDSARTREDSIWYVVQLYSSEADALAREHGYGGGGRGGPRGGTSIFSFSAWSPIATF